MEFELALTGIFLVVLVIVAIAKSALDELSDVSLRLLAAESNGHGAFWRVILERYHQFGFTLTFGIHLSIASIAILLTSLAHKVTQQHFLWLAFAGMLLTVVLFRQVIPLLLTQHNPEKTLLRLRVPLRVLWLVLGLLAGPIYKFFRVERVAPAETSEQEEETANEQELQAFIDVGEEEGIIEEDEGEMIQSIIRFGDRTAGEVMTPRPNIIAVSAAATLENVRDLMIESKYSRLPVYREQIDNIEGVIYVRDLLACWARGESCRRAAELSRETYFVPETKPIDELLREMQKAKTQMAIVIDEYGGLAGLVTLEDLLEEIVGEIEDEDEPEPQAAEVEITEEGAGVYAVRGNVEVGKVERLFETELAADDFTTVAGLVLNKLGHLPAVGETLDFNGLHFEVTEADERRVARLRIARTAVVAQAAPEEVSVERAKSF